VGGNWVRISPIDAIHCVPPCRELPRTQFLIVCQSRTTSKTTASDWSIQGNRFAIRPRLARDEKSGLKSALVVRKMELRKQPN
jgi:hypothetical protein